jgi:5'-methylthioadenosine phosphorylase
MCYATVAMVTDYYCWHADHDHVTVDQVIGTLLSNAEKAKNLVAATAPRLTGRTALCGAGCHRALDFALITAPDARDLSMTTKLDAIAGRVLDG